MIAIQISFAVCTQLTAQETDYPGVSYGKYPRVLNGHQVLTLTLSLARPRSSGVLEMISLLGTSAKIDSVVMRLSLTCWSPRDVQNIKNYQKEEHKPVNFVIKMHMFHLVSTLG